MSPDAVVTVMWLLVVLVVAAYVAFVLWRVRVHRARRREKAGAEAPSRRRRFRASPPGPLAAAEAAATAAATAAPPRAPSPGHSVAEAVTGIGLPCELAPLIDVERRPAAADHVAMVTTGYPAEHVARSLVDALERLGYQVSAPEGNERLARRAGTELRLAVHELPHRLQVGGRPAFPTAPEDGVVVELWTE